MRLYFEDCGVEHEFRVGWFEFWSARTRSGGVLVFRVPDGWRMGEIARRAEKKLRNRGMDTDFDLSLATDEEAGLWLSGHKKKAQFARVRDCEGLYA